MAQVPAFHDTIDSGIDNEGQKGGRNRSANHRHYARRRGMMDEVANFQPVTGVASIWSQQDWLIEELIAPMPAC